MGDILKIMTGGKRDTSPKCPRCGGDHLLMGCSEVSSICFDFDDDTRWVTVTFFDCREGAVEE